MKRKRRTRKQCTVCGEPSIAGLKLKHGKCRYHCKRPRVNNEREGTHMQAIVTKYLGPTNYKGSRVKATCEAGSLTLPWDSRLDIHANHDRAATALQSKLGWDKDCYKEMYRGGLPSGEYVYVFAGKYALVAVSPFRKRVLKGKVQT